MKNEYNKNKVLVDGVLGAIAGLIICLLTGHSNFLVWGSILGFIVGIFIGFVIYVLKVVRQVSKENTDCKNKGDRVPKSEGSVADSKESDLTPEELEDLALEEMSMRYIHHTTSKEKAAHMCADKVANYQAALAKIQQRDDNMRVAGNALYRSTKENEKSWALHGGIASGIAGGAAGVATAIRVQEQNREIRKRNDALAHSIAQVQVNSILKNLETASKIKKDMEFWKQQEALAQDKISVQLPVEELMKELHLDVISTEISAGGSVILGVKLNRTETLFIENMPVAVDGTVKIIIKSNGKYMGEAFLSLPCDGSDIGDAKLVTICRNPVEKHPSYETEIVPYHLWAVEVPRSMRPYSGNKDKECVYQSLKKNGATTLQDLINIMPSEHPEMELTAINYNNIKNILKRLEKEGRVVSTVQGCTLYYRVKE